MLDTDKLGYVGHLSLRMNITYVDVIIWTSLRQLCKMRNLVYGENLNNVLSEKCLKTYKQFKHSFYINKRNEFSSY